MVQSLAWLYRPHHQPRPLQDIIKYQSCLPKWAADSIVASHSLNPQPMRCFCVAQWSTALSFVLECSITTDVLQSVESEALNIIGISCYVFETHRHLLFAASQNNRGLWKCLVIIGSQWGQNEWRGRDETNKGMLFCTHEATWLMLFFTSLDSQSSSLCPLVPLTLSFSMHMFLQ